MRRDAVSVLDGLVFDVQDYRTVAKHAVIGEARPLQDGFGGGPVPGGAGADLNPQLLTGPDGVDVDLGDVVMEIHQGAVDVRYDQFNLVHKSILPGKKARNDCAYRSSPKISRKMALPTPPSLLVQVT